MTDAVHYLFIGGPLNGQYRHVLEHYDILKVATSAPYLDPMYSPATGIQVNLEECITYTIYTKYNSNIMVSEEVKWVIDRGGRS